MKSSALTLDLQKHVSLAMSCVSSKCLILYLIILFELFFDLPRSLSHLEGQSSCNSSHVHLSLLLIWSKHFSLASLILSSIGVTPNLSLITSFLILSNLVWTHIHLIILIWVTINIWTWVLLICQHSELHNNTNLTLW